MNYTRKSVHGLSWELFFLWTLADISNAVGAYLTNQFTTQQWTGVYFLITDLILLFQYMYYTFYFTRFPSENESECEPEETNAFLSSPSASYFNVAPIFGLAVLCQQYGETVKDIPGSVLAWISGFLYLCARLPQIRINYKLKSLSGVSLSLFSITFLANIFYSLSILLRYDEITMEQLFRNTLPFLIGSLGAIFFDMIIFGQFYLYQQSNREVEEDQDEDRVPLLFD